jgi:hypothetical protein
MFKRMLVTVSLALAALATETPAWATPPTTCPNPGYVHGGLFSSQAPGSQVEVTIQTTVLSVTGTRDHAHATVAVQDGGTLDNYLEAGIGVFGHRGIFTPHFWAFYKPVGVPAQQGQFFDLGVTNSQQHLFELRHLGSGAWEVWIDGTSRLPTPTPVHLVDIEWTTIFNENYNDDNSQCDPMHAFYTSASHPYNTGGSDPELYRCRLGNDFNWEIHWATESGLCSIDFGDPFGGSPGSFPSSPVVGD